MDEVSLPCAQHIAMYPFQLDESSWCTPPLPNVCFFKVHSNIPIWPSIHVFLFSPLRANAPPNLP
jgi:hypothetical protein